MHVDLGRLFAGDPTAGVLMTGFFPSVMSAAPVAPAVSHEAGPSRNKPGRGIVLGIMPTAFLIGTTEALESASVFVGRSLHRIHAVLTGTSMTLVNAPGLHHGSRFSAGAVDCLPDSGIVQEARLPTVIGLGHDGLLRFVIRRWNLRTPGRETETEDAPSTGASGAG